MTKLLAGIALIIAGVFVLTGRWLAGIVLVVFAVVALIVEWLR